MQLPGRILNEAARLASWVQVPLFHRGGARFRRRNHVGAQAQHYQASTSFPPLALCCQWVTSRGSVPLSDAASKFAAGPLAGCEDDGDSGPTGTD